MAEYSCVSIDKAALRSLACTLHQELKEKGIFVGIVTIMGNVVPETHYAPEKIAEVYWKMYQERKVWDPESTVLSIFHDNHILSYFFTHLL